MSPNPNMTEIEAVTTTRMTAIYTKHDDSPLLAQDRCDSCSGQAYGVACVKGVDLMFCGHHLAKHLDRLMLVADTIDDYTRALSQTGMTSANAL